MSERSKYLNKWDREHSRQIHLKFNLKNDEELLDSLSKIGNMQGYFKFLAYKDIHRQKLVDARGFKLPDFNSKSESYFIGSMVRRIWLQIAVIEHGFCDEFINEFFCDNRRNSDWFSSMKDINAYDYLGYASQRLIDDPYLDTSDSPFMKIPLEELGVKLDEE